MSNPYATIDLDANRPQRERVALPPGKYGNSREPALKVVSALGTRETRTPGLFSHSLLTAHVDGVAGTAFLPIQLREEWLTPGYIGLAMNNEGIGTEEERQAAMTALASAAATQARANNTPAAQMEEATETIYNNILTQIRINVGTIFRLQDWAGLERNPTTDLTPLVGTQFSGTVEPNNDGTSRIKSVYSKSRGSTSAATTATT